MHKILPENTLNFSNSLSIHITAHILKFNFLHSNFIFTGLINLMSRKLFHFTNVTDRPESITGFGMAARDSYSQFSSHRHLDKTIKPLTVVVGGEESDDFLRSHTFSDIKFTTTANEFARSFRVISYHFLIFSASFF